MVTADEVGEVTIFAELGVAERERLARAAADIGLAPGSTPCTRAASARSSPCSRAASR